MTLKTFISKRGYKEIAKELNIDPTTVCNWKNSKRFPRPKYLVWLHQKSGGKVSYSEMIRPFARTTK